MIEFLSVDLVLFLLVSEQVHLIALVVSMRLDLTLQDELLRFQRLLPPLLIIGALDPFEDLEFNHVDGKRLLDRSSFDMKLFKVFCNR